MATALAGLSRVLMAGRLVEAPSAARVQALLVQAVQLVVQIVRMRAAQQEAGEAQRPVGWGFDRTGAQVLAAAREEQGGTE
ncbi:MAG: hypothetical protein QOI76_4201 [Frankiales bacterium]|nr:hypothetical protein [Frankiales bacterium]